MLSKSKMLVALGVVSCGGAIVGQDASTSADGSTDSGTTTVNDGGSSDCTPPMTPCTSPCPPGQWCLRQANGMVVKELGCTKIPASCPMGDPTCDCMKRCFCTRVGAMCAMGSGVAALTCF